MKNPKFTLSSFKMVHRIAQYLVDICISVMAMFITDAVFISINIKYTAWDNLDLFYMPFMTALTLLFFTINDVYNYRERRLDETITRTIASLAKSMALLLIAIYFVNLS